MTDREIMLLCSYVYNNRIQLEHDVHQIQNNIRFREVDVPDCVELIVALQRLDTFKEVTGHIMSLLGLSDGGKHC